MALTYREGGKRIEMSPEQEAATRARWAEAETTTKEMINDEAKLNTMKEDLSKIRAQLGRPGASKEVARIAFELMAE